MGISTLASYRNSHLFEVLGLEEQICHEFFEDAGRYPGTKSLINVLPDYLNMQRLAYSNGAEGLPTLASYRFRKGAELHANSPEFIRRLHAHTGNRSPSIFRCRGTGARLRGPPFLTRFTGNVAEQPVHLDDVNRSNPFLSGQHTSHVSRFVEPEAHKL